MSDKQIDFKIGDLVHVPAYVSIYQEALDGAISRSIVTKKPDLGIVLDCKQSAWGQILIFFDGDYWRINEDDLFMIDDKIDTT